jgi:hypothetical protein
MMTDGLKQKLLLEYTAVVIDVQDWIAASRRSGTLWK